MVDTPSRILFVHNSDSGRKNMIIDGLKKMVTPLERYPCRLCALTYGPVSMKPEWKSFVASLETPVEFIYKDQFAKKFPGNPFALPAVFIDDGTQLEEKISANEFAELNDLPALLAVARQRLK